MREEYNVEICDDADYVFFSDNIETDTLNKLFCSTAKKIYYSFENRPVYSKKCDWAFTFNHEIALHDGWFQHIGPILSEETAKSLVKKRRINQKLENTRIFCCFIYSHDVPFRNWLFNQISTYKRVDSPGQCMNNMQPITPKTKEDRTSHFHRNWQEEKIKFCRQYKFCMACENSSSPGYHTEKIIHAMQAGCIPIYWGDPLIHHEFNEKSFVNFHYYERKVLAWVPKFLFKIPKVRVLVRKILQIISAYLMVERIRQIDNNPELYAQYLNEPWYIDNMPTFYAKKERMKERLRMIFG